MRVHAEPLTPLTCLGRGGTRTGENFLVARTTIVNLLTPVPLRDGPRVTASLRSVKRSDANRDEALREATVATRSR